VVHVYGGTLFHAVAHHFDGRAPAALDARFAALATALRDRAFGRIEHGLAAAPAGAAAEARNSYVLQPVVAPLTRDRASVRAALGLGGAAPLAAVYLNPHFRDRRLADALARALFARGVHLYGVAEGLADAPGFRAYDPRLADVVAAADVLISAPGMAASTQARLFGTPMVALLTDQPEQRGNAAAWGTSPAAMVPLELARTPPEGLADALGRAIDRARTAPRVPPGVEPADVVARIHARWCDALITLGRAASAAPSARSGAARVHTPNATLEASR
jgi:hypothetical protein